jgi:hypothetical protein
MGTRGKAQRFERAEPGLRVPRRLQLEEFGVDPATRDERLVCSCLRDAPSTSTTMPSVRHADALRDELDSAATRDPDFAIPQGVSVNLHTDVRHSSGTSPLLNGQSCAEAQDKGTRRADRCVDLLCLPSPSRL